MCIANGLLFDVCLLEVHSTPHLKQFANFVILNDCTHSSKVRQQDALILAVDLLIAL